jgi:hypothetical protein
MNHILNPCRKRIPRRQGAARRDDLEKSLLAALNSGPCKPMTSARKKRIYLQALVAVLPVACW